MRARRGLYLDDYLVLVGTICLCADTVLFYQECNDFMLASAVQSNPSIVPRVNSDAFDHMIRVSFSDFFASFTLVWSTIYAVKCSFLALFQILIERVTKIRTYYWCVVVITVVSWLVTVLEPTFLCHHPGLSISTTCAISFLSKSKTY